MRTADVVVIGGGLHGCSAALHLGRAGLRCLVLEKDYVGRHASGVNAGGVRRLGRHLAEVPLSVASLELWHRIADLVDDTCGFESHGQVKVAESEAELEALRKRVATLADLGFHHEELIDRGELRAILPAVSPHCVGGLVSRADGAALPYRTTLAFKRAAERHGATFLEDTRALEVKQENGVWRMRADREAFEAKHLVNCAGAWAGNIAAPFVKPVVGATSRPLSFKQYANGTVMIGGGQRGHAEPATNRTILDYAKLASNARTASEIFPCMKDADIVRAWAGIEGRMPDDIPVIGPSSTHENAWHAFGFSAHGFQLGPIVGSIIAELMKNGSTGFPIEPFSIKRFPKPPS